VLAHAARRAGPDGYLIVVHALPLGVPATDAETGRAYAGRTRAVLRTIEAALPEGTSHETRIVAGPASKALLETADRCGADEIVLGASTGRAARGAIGRVADTVLRRSERPVTIVPQNA
jgi:nucleotide-binding universal stress UspA family protein